MRPRRGGIVNSSSLILYEEGRQRRSEDTDSCAITIPLRGHLDIIVVVVSINRSYVLSGRLQSAAQKRGIFYEYTHIL